MSCSRPQHSNAGTNVFVGLCWITCADPGFFLSGGGGKGPGSSTYFTDYRGGQMVLLHIFQGSNFSREGGGGQNANFYRSPCNYNL